MSDVSQGEGWWQASDGKWYPPQSAPAAAPPPPPTAYQQPYQPPYQPPYQQGYPAGPAPKKGHGCLWAILAVLGLGFVLLIVIIIVAATATKKVSDDVAKNGFGGRAPAAAYKVGDTADTAGIKATVYGVKDPYAVTDPAFAPRAGDHYVVVDVQIGNPGGDQKTFSSVIGFHLIDGQNRQYAETVVAGLEPGPPDGQLAGGQSVRGNVAFEVPDGTTGLKLRVQGDLTAAGAVFALS